MKNENKRLKQEYKQTQRAMGVFLIRNIIKDKIFLAAGLDLEGAINRHKFQLAIGKHPHLELQADWKTLGSTNFAFEILDQMKPPQDPNLDRGKELAFMETMWLQQLKPFDDRSYNERKLNREERLRRIAANRRGGF
jgi:hypothetical protein